MERLSKGEKEGMEIREASREEKKEIVVVKLEAKIEILRKWEVFTLVVIL